MKLLSPEKIEKEEKRSDEELRSRVEKLKVEETKVAKQLNALKEEERKQKHHLDVFIVETEAQLGVKKTILFQEVESLEKRKEEALKPINEIKNNAEKLLNDARTANDRLNAKNAEFDAKFKENNEKITERLEDVIDKEHEISDKSTELDNRELGIKAAETEIKKSTDNLGAEWVKFHEKVYVVNGDLERREKEVEDAKKANDAIRQSNEAEAARLRQEDRAIRDKYVALEQAKQHLGIK